MDQRSKALVLLQQIGGTHKICQRARTLVTTRTRRTCTRDVDVHARSWQHAHDANAHEMSMQPTLVKSHNTRRPRTHTRHRRARMLVRTHTRHACTRYTHAKHAREHTPTMATRKCEHAHTRARCGKRWEVSLFNDGHVWIRFNCTASDALSRRMRYSHLYVVDTDNCRGQQWWVSTYN